MFDKLKKIFESPPAPKPTATSSRPAPTPPPRSAEEQAVWDKVLSYPLAAWNVVHTPGGYMSGGSSKTHLETVNPSGNEVKVVFNENYYTTYDSNDVPDKHPSFSYDVTIDGQRLGDLSQPFLGSLYSTLKDRVEGDPAYHQRLKDEARSLEEARTKERKDLYDKL